MLDYPELHHLLNLGETSNAGDVSMMINAERRANGARDDRYLIK